MKNSLIYIRNLLIHFLYTKLLKKVYFQLDPEVVHDRMTLAGRVLGSNPCTREITSWLFSYSHPGLEQKILGIKFKNPIGLAAGFDKDAVLTNILPSVGFGFAEVGSITGEPCEGNPKPRLWRLKKSQGLVVYYGLKNQGSEKIASRLEKKKFTIPIGTSIAKTNSPETVETEAGIEDYVKAYKNFVYIGSYFTINISCPNAFGGEPFTDPQKLDLLLTQIDKIPTQKPVFLKMPSDLSEKEVDQLLEVVEKHKVHGFICSNLAKSRQNIKIKDDLVPKNGGMSGKIVEELSNNLISYLYQKTQGKYIIIGCGGVFNADDAYKKIKLGASLIQMVTGMIFEGPQVISEINQGLVRLLQKDDYTNISEAIGSSAVTN